MSNENTYIVWGPPGTGKTTWLADETRKLILWAAKWHPENRTPVLLCSMTRTAAAEIAGRGLPVARQCIGTLHAHAYRALGNPAIAEAHVDDFNATQGRFCLTAAKADVNEPDWDRHQAAAADSLAEHYQLLRARQVPRDDWPNHILGFAAAWEHWKDEAGLLDFADLIDQAAEQVPAAPGNPLVIIADEAQDLSAAEYRLLRRWATAAGRLIIAGDPYQSLYTWRGATPEVFLDPAVPQEHRKLLAQSWRVPRAVHDLAMTIIERLSGYQPITYAPRDDDGWVEPCAGTWKQPDHAIDRAEEHLARGHSVMLTASCGFFLAPTVRRLRERGIPFSNPWRRKRGDWNPLGGSGTTAAQRILSLIDGLRDGRAEWTTPDLQRWMSPLVTAGTLHRGSKARLADLDDADVITLPDLADWLTVEAYSDLLEHIGAGDHAGLVTWWQDRLTQAKVRGAAYPADLVTRWGSDVLRKEPQVYVGTSHSYKGGEADVVILFPDLSPQGMKAMMSHGEAQNGVVRMAYVAVTRARYGIDICKPASKLGFHRWLP